MKNLIYLILPLLLLWSGCNPTPTNPTNSFTDSRDGEVYMTVTHCGATWMAENLRYNLPGSVVDQPMYGRFYKQEAIAGTCPPGWHLPSDAEWNSLETCLGMDPADADSLSYAEPGFPYPARGGHGLSMKSVTTWNIDNGTNSSEMNIYPAGLRYSVTLSTDLFGETCIFFTSDTFPGPTSGPNPWPMTRRFTYNKPNEVIRYYANGEYLSSCRCVQD